MAPARSGSSLMVEMPIDLRPAELVTEPFLHFALRECLDTSVAEELLVWFETEAPWQKQEIAGFYELNKVDLMSVCLPPSLVFLQNQVFLSILKQDLMRIFGRPLSGDIRVDAHRLNSGLKIGIHTDYGEQKQSIRLLIQLNRGWNPSNGGLLMLLPERNPVDIADNQALYLPHHRSAVGFAISPRSFHAVTPVVSGERFTLCFSVCEI